MKRNLLKSIAIIITVLSLGSCSRPVEIQHSSEESTSIKEEATVSPSQNEILSYYESAINQLEDSIIELKEDFYITEQEYKSTIRELEEKIILLNSQKEHDTSDGNEMENIVYNPFSYVIEDGVAIITSYSGSSDKITVPSKIGKTQVKKIGELTFTSDIKSIIISEGIEEIDWFAFSKCKSLQEIYIPSSVTLIGYGAFEGCPQNLVIHCPSSSYAEAYAKSFALNYITE